MQVATTGLVLRQVKVGEADRILTILTPDLGVVSASARGSLRMKSALFSATGLFCYSEFTLTSGRSHYFVDAAQVKKVFHGISASIEGMALASYMAEIAAELSPAPPEADAQLRLLLNCLYMISERHYPCAQLKAIYELRALTLAGYMPDVLACAGCGKYDGGEFYLDPVEGRLDVYKRQAQHLQKCSIPPRNAPRTVQLPGQPRTHRISANPGQQQRPRGLGRCQPQDPLHGPQQGGGRRGSGQQLAHDKKREQRG